MNFTVFITYLYVIAFMCFYFLSGFVTDFLITMNILYLRYTINFYDK